MQPLDGYRRKVEKTAIRSDHLGEQRTLRVFLPPGYDRKQRWPVVYCQDGEQFFQFGRIATAAEKLALEEGRVAPLIVGVDVDLRHRTEEYSPGGSRFADYCTFFLEEMMPWAETHFGASDWPEERILAGDSLGGTVSLHLALDHPGLFRQVISLSGAFFPDSLERVARESRLNWLKMYQLIGTEETAVDTVLGVFDFLSLNRKMHRLLTERGAQVEYLEEEGTHVWGFWQNYMADALRRFLP